MPIHCLCEMWIWYMNPCFSTSSSWLLTITKANNFSSLSLATQTIVGQIRQDRISLELVPANKSCPVHSIPRCFVLISLWFWLGGMAGIVAPLFSFLLQTELENKREGKVCGCFWLCTACLLGVVSHFRQKCGWPCSLCYLTLSLFPLPYPSLHSLINNAECLFI